MSRIKAWLRLVSLVRHVGVGAARDAVAAAIAVERQYLDAEARGEQFPLIIRSAPEMQLPDVREVQLVQGDNTIRYRGYSAEDVVLVAHGLSGDDAASWSPAPPGGRFDRIPTEDRL